MPKAPVDIFELILKEQIPEAEKALKKAKDLNDVQRTQAQASLALRKAIHKAKEGEYWLDAVEAFESMSPDVTSSIAGAVRAELVSVFQLSGKQHYVDRLLKVQRADMQPFKVVEPKPEPALVQSKCIPRTVQTQRAKKPYVPATAAYTTRSTKFPRTRVRAAPQDVLPEAPQSEVHTPLMDRLQRLGPLTETERKFIGAFPSIDVYVGQAIVNAAIGTENALSVCAQLKEKLAKLGLRCVLIAGHGWAITRVQ